MSTPVSLFSFPNQLEPLGKKTETLDLTADIPLSCPTQVIREGLLYSPPETQSSDLTLPPSFSTTAFSLPILPLAWEWMDFRVWRKLMRMERREEGAEALTSLRMGEAGGEEA